MSLVDGQSEDERWVQSMIDESNKEFARLNADNARLRALVKEAEWARCTIVPDYDATETECSCAWCDSAGRPHKPDCPAFTPEGEVR